jgi:integrase
MMFLVHTGIRVDEALCVRYEDILPDEKDPELCYITVRGGKLAYRMKATECVGMVGATNAIQRRKATNPDYKPSDLLFPKNPREKLNELLVAAGLNKNEQGERRTAKNFRHTFIMLRLLHGVDVYKLAKNCRTSVKMIESHYGSYINARMSKDELTKFKK